MAEEEEKEVADRRRQILGLQSDASRKKETLERLREKKKALEDELTARSEDKQTIEQDIATEMRKQSEHRENRHADNGQDQAVSRFINTEIRSMLRDRIPVFKADDEVEEDSDDEEDQGDEDQPDETAKAAQHDSTIVTYLNASTAEADKLVEYRVSYRLDKEITAGQLHEDACEYWGCSKDEFILCKPTKDTGEPERIESKDLESPVTSQAILNKNKRAHLILAHKDLLGVQKNLLAKAALDVEKAMAKMQGTEADDSAMTTLKHGGKAQELKEEDHMATAFAKWPGVHSLLKVKQRPAFKKWSQIKCRDLFLYITLALFTGLVMMLRSQAKYYWLREGVLESVGIGVPGETSIQSYGVVNINSVRQYEDMWRWTQGSFHYQVFNPASTLRKFYTPEGFVRVRQQKSKEYKDSECRRKEVPASQRNGPCYTIYVDEQQQAKDTLIVDAASWINTQNSSSVLGRLITPNPLEWTASKDYSARTVGHMQYSYAGSGYTVDYDLSHANASSTFLADMDVFRVFWLSVQTRLFIIEVNLANYNMGGFVSCVFQFEISPSGNVFHTMHLRPLDIGDTKDGGIGVVILNVFRGIIVGYIMTMQVFTEAVFKASQGKSGLQYIFSFMGLLDMSTVSLFVAMSYMRGKYDPPKMNGMTTFYSYSQEGFFNEQINVCEGIFLIIIMIRFCFFMRLHPNVNQYWKMFGKACYMFCFWLVIFIPIFLGMMMFAHCLYSPRIQHFSTWWEVTISLITFVKQDFSLELLYEKHSTWTLLYVCGFQLIIVFFLINGFLAITVHSYFQVQLTDGLTKERKSWSRDQWMDWILAAPIYRCVFRRPPGASKREEGGDDEDGDDGSSSDEDGDEKDD